MSTNKQSPPTIGVLAGWQVYHGALHSFLDLIFQGIRSATRDRHCHLLLACGITPGHNILRPAWPVLSPDSDFVPVGPENTDGLIVVAPLLSETRSRYVQELRRAGHPLVFVGSGEAGPAVVPDNAGGIQQALMHLIEHGHRRIAFIAGIEGDLGDSGDRLQAYHAAARKYGLETDERLIAYGFHTIGDGRRAAQQILDSGAAFTAVVASNDDSAQGAMQVFQERGLRIPHDVAIIGFDDRHEAIAQLPPLTTVHYPTVEVGYQAVVLLLKHLRGEAAEAEIVPVPTWLAIRQSCGCQPGGFLPPERQSGNAEPVGLEAQASVKPEPLLISKNRERILQDLALALSKAALSESRRLSPDEVSDLCRHLAEAWATSLQQADSFFFRLAFSEILRRVEALEDDPHAWQGVLSVLESTAPMVLEAWQFPERQPAAEALVRQARIAISESMRRQYGRYVVEQRWVADQVSLLTARLLMTQDEAQVLEALQDYLPGVGIRHAHVFFFEPEKGDPVAWSALRTRLPSTRAGKAERFASRSFPPAGLYAPDELLSLALLPLIIQEETLGFVALDAVDLGLCATIVWQLAAAFKSAQLYRLKNRFLSMVSHELRTPLNLIAGLSEMLLREQAQPEQSPQYQADLERIHASAQHLSGLIRDVLDLSNSEVGQLKLASEPLDLAAVLAIVTETGQQLAQDKGLAWRVEIQENLPAVWGDRTRLRQVALNLVSNAVKFTEQGTITLTVERIASQDEVGRMKEEGGKLQVEGFSSSFIPHPAKQSFIPHPSAFILISVSDTGLGIPPAEQEMIFDEFRQSERTTARGYGGLGLGLAICKRLVEMHGGEIGVISSGEEGAGSTFYFTLPVWKEREAAVEPAAQPPTVWVLAEQAGNGEPLSAHLRRQGFEVTIFSVNAHLDWSTQLLVAGPPGAVVLDLGLASERGWEILKTLKDNPATRDIPVLFYSLTEADNAGSWLEVDYLMKPVAAAELEQALARQGLSEAGSPGTKTVLIVDDDPGILEIHARMVQSQSPAYHVLKARNGREALARLQETAVDLVLLDLMMPELDGFGVLEAMREVKATQQTPVIVLTAQTLSEMDMTRLNQGVATVLGKGLFSIKETLAHVEAALRRGRKLGSEAQRLVRKAMAYIHTHYTEPLSRESLARYVGVSDDYLTRCFHQETGLAPMTYLNRYRINQAKTLLAEGRLNMAEVAEAVGFSDSNHFGRAFKREVGMSPSAYREGKRDHPRAE
jgi:signal transduction histidine kinase/DNA-binding response OmpR family regulator